MRALSDAFKLDMQGNFAEVIQIAEPLTADPSLAAIERGQAWMLLGIAYHQQGKFQQAANAYDQSLHLLGANPENSAHYAATLIAYGTLYHDMGRSADAERVEEKALHISDQNGDHTGVAMACKSLAATALSAGRVKEGRKYLERTEEEARSALNLNADFFASLSSMQGKLDEMEKKPGDAVAAYRHAVTLLQQSHGNRHVMVGWTYVLLGNATGAVGNYPDALAEMREGLSILDDTVGRMNVHYISSELAYARVLDASGLHDKAQILIKMDEGLLKSFYQSQCVQCSVSVAALAMK
jgi:tetratricopeptide (TPR) repeat protein